MWYYDYTLTQRPFCHTFLLILLLVIHYFNSGKFCLKLDIIFFLQSHNIRLHIFFKLFYCFDNYLHAIYAIFNCHGIILKDKNALMFISFLLEMEIKLKFMVKAE